MGVALEVLPPKNRFANWRRCDLALAVGLLVRLPWPVFLPTVRSRGDNCADAADGGQAPASSGGSRPHKKALHLCEALAQAQAFEAKLASMEAGHSAEAKRP